MRMKFEQTDDGTLVKETSWGEENFTVIFLSLFLALQPPQWARASLFSSFLDHTQRRTTVSRTPLDEWSARRSNLYLTTHKTHNKQTSMSQAGFETTILMVILPLLLMRYIETVWIPLQFSATLLTRNWNIRIFLSSTFSPPSVFRIYSYSK